MMARLGGSKDSVCKNLRIVPLPEPGPPQRKIAQSLDATCAFFMMRASSFFCNCCETSLECSLYSSSHHSCAKLFFPRPVQHPPEINKGPTCPRKMRRRRCYSSNPPNVQMSSIRRQSISHHLSPCVHHPWPSWSSSPIHIQSSLATDVSGVALLESFEYIMFSLRAIDRITLFCAQCALVWPILYLVESLYGHPYEW